MTPTQPDLEDIRQQHDHKLALLVQIRTAERRFLAGLDAGENDAPSRDTSSRTPGKPSLIKKAAAFAVSPKQWHSAWQGSRPQKVQRHASVYASVAQTFLGVPGIDLSAIAAGLMTLLSPIGQMPAAMRHQGVSEHTAPAKNSDVSLPADGGASPEPHPSAITPAHPDDRLIAKRRRMAEYAESEAEKYRALKETTTNVDERREHQDRIGRAEKLAAQWRESEARLGGNSAPATVQESPSVIQPAKAPAKIQPKKARSSDDERRIWQELRDAPLKPSTHQRAADYQPATVDAQPTAIPTAKFADADEPIPTAKFASDEAHWTSTNQANPFEDAHAVKKPEEDADEPIHTAQLAPETAVRRIWRRRRRESDFPGKPAVRRNGATRVRRQERPDLRSQQHHPA